MNKCMRIILVVTLTNLIFINLSFGEEQRHKLLYGELTFSDAPPFSRRVIIPISNFKVELFRVFDDTKKKEEKLEKPLFTTYPGSNGYYTFRDVSEGEYNLRISYVKYMGKEYLDDIVVEKKINVRYNQKGRMRVFPIELIVVWSEGEK